MGNKGRDSSFQKRVLQIYIKEVNSVPYRLVRPEFIVPVPMPVQKQVSFVSENIPALLGRFGCTGDLYQISASKFIPYRKKKSVSFSFSPSTSNDLYILDLKLSRGLILAAVSSSSSPLSLSLSLYPSNFLFLSLFFGFSNLSNDI